MPRLESLPITISRSPRRRAPSSAVSVILSFSARISAVVFGNRDRWQALCAPDEGVINFLPVHLGDGLEGGHFEVWILVWVVD